MEVLDSTVTVSLNPNTSYTIRMIDQNDLEVIETTGTSSANGNLIIPLPTKYTKYDGWFALEISRLGSIVYLDTVSTVRPYVNIARIVEYMEDKIDEDKAIEYESIARKLINAIVGFEFNFVHKNIHVTGNGTDFIVTDDRILKVYSVAENNVTIWTDGEEFEYYPWVNLRGIVQNGVGINEHQNRMEHVLSWYNRYDGPLFRNGWDYIFEVDAGWPVIPQDIQDATLLLINDIVCGNNRYYNKYISGVRGPINLTYFPQVIAGTGNLYVDNILSKYVLESVRAKVI